MANDSQRWPEVPFIRRKKKGVKTLPWFSPLDLQEKEAIKGVMGEIHLENMWKLSTHTLITNTGNFLTLELGSPGVLKWKPAGDVSYGFSGIKLVWAFDDYGSAHSIQGQKYALEMVSTFKYSYDVIVPPEIIFKRIELHELYKALAATEDENQQKMLSEKIEKTEADYDEVESTVLNENYVHSVGKEALSHRKPTSFHIGGLKSAAPIPGNTDNDVDDERDESDGEEEIEDIPTEEKQEIDFYRLVKFRKERAAIELAAKRFYPFYTAYMDKKGAYSKFTGENEISTTDIIDYLSESKNRSRRQSTTDNYSPEASIDDSPMDPKMFPNERDRERERARRLKYLDEKQKREQAETEQKLNWITTHKINIYVKFSILFEVQNNAPYYNLFSYLARVKEPFSRVLVDGNLLTPFSEAMTTSEYFSYVGGRFYYPDEEVIRIVKKTPLPIQSDQLWTLRTLKNEFGKMMESTMPTEIQKLNGREVFYNVPIPKIEPPTCPGKDRCMCELDSEPNWQAYTKI